MAIEQLDNAPRCQHIRLSGRQCKAPARRGNNYCLFHEKEHDTSPNLSFPPVEDAATVQVAADQVLQALRNNTIEFPRAALMLSGLRLMRANLKRLGLEMDDEIEAGRGRPAYKKEEDDEGPGLLAYLLEQSGELRPGEEELLKHATIAEQMAFFIQRLQLVPPDSPQGTQRNAGEPEGGSDHPVIGTSGEQEATT